MYSGLRNKCASRQVKSSYSTLSESIHEDMNRLIVILMTRFKQNLNRFMGIRSDRFRQNLNRFSIVWMNQFTIEVNRFTQLVTIFHVRQCEITFPYISPNWELRNIY